MLDSVIDGLEESMQEILAKGWTCDSVMAFVTRRKDMMWRVLNTKTTASDEWNDSIESHYHNLTDHERLFLAKNAALLAHRLKAFARQFKAHYHTAFQCYRPAELGR